ncbi:MAG: hypothetical protein RLZZ611_2581 [Cyanobacteriota bacterium]|jgi:stage II sporulation protein D
MARFQRCLPLPLALVLLALPPLLVNQPAGAQQSRSDRMAAAPAPGQDPQLRVLLQAAPTLQLAVVGADGFRLRDHQGRVLQELRSAQALQLQVDRGWLEARAVLMPSASGAVPVAGGVLAAPQLWIEPLVAAPTLSPDPALVVQQRRYRGRLQLLVRDGAVQVINHVPLETYLASVVGSEMPASWPQQALQAQAVAARTYALKARKPAAAYDLKATVASQVYRGIEAETPSTRQAVEATRGLVITYGRNLIDAVFHSSSGGSTESSGDLWPQQLPYLVSVPDFDQDSPVHQWRQPLDPALLTRAFAEIGGLRGIEVLATTPSGRVRQVRVVGPAGQLVLSGANLRSRLGLRSTWVRFELDLPAMNAASPTAGSLAAAPLAPPLEAPPPLPAFSLPPTDAQPVVAAAAALSLPRWVAVGRGFGHGIGMSQWGAYGLARRGESYVAILRHYYRGTQLTPYSQLALVPAAASGSAGVQASAADAQVVATASRPRP